MTGEICVKSRTVFPGYFNQPELSKLCKDGDNFYRTGDLGYIEDRNCG